MAISGLFAAPQFCNLHPAMAVGSAWLQTWLCEFNIYKKKVKSEYSSPWEYISELRGVTCHMESHSVTCHPTPVNAPRHNPSQPGRYSIYLPGRDGRLS